MLCAIASAGQHSDALKGNGAWFESCLGQYGVDDETGEKSVEHGGLRVGFDLRGNGQIGKDADDESDGPGNIARPVDAFARSGPAPSGEQIIRRHGAADGTKRRPDDGK